MEMKSGVVGRLGVTGKLQFKRTLPDGTKEIVKEIEILPGSTLPLTDEGLAQLLQEKDDGSDDRK